MIAKVYVNFKKTILDPQGRTIQKTLESLGYKEVLEVRQGKVFTLKFKDNLPKEKVEEIVKKIGKDVLSNPVIEDFEYEVME